MTFMTKDGQEAYHSDDNDPLWFEPTENPFLLGCCSCGLMHRVKYRIIKNTVEFRFTRDDDETERLRHYLGKQPSEGEG